MKVLMGVVLRDDGSKEGIWETEIKKEHNSYKIYIPKEIAKGLEIAEGSIVEVTMVIR